MTYEWLYFDHFNLLIFNFAEPTDFLLVAAREPVLLVFTVVSVLVLVKFIERHSRRLGRVGNYQKMYRWLQSKPWGGMFERLCYLVLVVGYFVSLTSVYASYRAERVHKGLGNKVRVELMSDAAAKPGPVSGKVYLLLGNTSKYLLVYDAVEKATEILSANNVVRIITQP